MARLDLAAPLAGVENSGKSCGEWLIFPYNMVEVTTYENQKSSDPIDITYPCTFSYLGVCSKCN